ncbi:MAG: D-sedoheptulose 7-phosphate isomerase [Betaproteobacteria bacterium]|nr:D-sedoheptulose 7-phosphate isomerase [Burkholderiales bacterium]MCE2645726.1 D-sedoheptulose 7-phosphate isomerase [Burkholderiaceae bacterium]
MSREVVRAALQQAHAALEALLADEAMLANIERAGALLAATFVAGGKVYSCGNGGSMCDAMHFAEELTGRYRDDRPGYAATAIADASHLSCVGNDYGYEQVFARYVQAHGRSGDVLLAITTSGTSKNVVAAAKKARELGVNVIALTGKPDTPITELADIAIVTPGGKYADRVQELHIKVIHILIELVERKLAPGNYEEA